MLYYCFLNTKGCVQQEGPWEYSSQYEDLYCISKLTINGFGSSDSQRVATAHVGVCGKVCHRSVPRTGQLATWICAQLRRGILEALRI